jgi:hypothetical protein
MSTAAETIRAANPNAFIAFEDGYVVALEDHADPDGRMFRIEYRATPDGQKAIAVCRYNPWQPEDPQAGEDYLTAHVAPDGFLCLGEGHESHAVADSPFAIDFVIRRARFWCTGFSVLKETGSFPDA